MRERRRTIRGLTVREFTHRKDLFEAGVLTADIIAQLEQTERAIGAPMPPDVFELLCRAPSLTRVQFCFWLLGRDFPSREPCTPCTTVDLISAAQLNALSESQRDMIAQQFRCEDCDIDTLTIHEYYAVRDALWHAHGAKGGMLCVGCFEERLGRKLTLEDFEQVPINTPTAEHPKSARLLSRLRGDMPSGRT